MSSTRPQSTKPQSENSDSAFKFGPLRGRPEFFYEHVPLCPEDPNCFRSTCGYCHPRRDSQNTHWSWVYPLENNNQPRPEPKPVARSAVPPLLFGKQYNEKLEPSAPSRESSLFEDNSFMLPNFDFLDNDTHNPWDFKSSDLKNDLDGPSLRKVDSSKALNKTPKKKVRSSLRTDALPFLPSSSGFKFFSPTSSPQKEKGGFDSPKISSAPSSPPLGTHSLLQTTAAPPSSVPKEKMVHSTITKPPITTTTSSPLVIEKKFFEEIVIPQPVGVDAFLRRMEVIKLASKSSTQSSPIPTPIPSLPLKPPTAATPPISSIQPISTITTTTTTTTTTTSTIPEVASSSSIAEPTKVVESMKPLVPSPTTTKSKSKAIPVVPPFKSKITTHTRTEQESLAPILPLRGGSSTSTTVITEITSPKSAQMKHESKKSVSVGEIMVEREETQSLDTGAKPQTQARWFLVMWTFVCSWILELGQDIKDMVMLLWATIIAKLATSSSSTSTSHTTKPAPSSPRHNQMKKPIPSKHVKGYRGKDGHEGRMRK